VSKAKDALIVDLCDVMRRLVDDRDFAPYVSQRERRRIDSGEIAWWMQLRAHVITRKWRPDWRKKSAAIHVLRDPIDGSDLATIYRRDPENGKGFLWAVMEDRGDSGVTRTVPNAVRKAEAAIARMVRTPKYPGTDEESSDDAS
jgi:hypothetical protein